MRPNLKWENLGLTQTFNYNSVPIFDVTYDTCRSPFLNRTVLPFQLELCFSAMPY